MQGEVTVTVSVAVEQCEPDGRACAVCGDVPYLAAYALVPTVNGKRNPRAHQTPLCGSCGPIVKQELESGE